MKGICNSLLYIAVLMSFVVSSCSMGDLEAPERESDDPPGGYVMKFVRKGVYFGMHDEFRIYSDGRVLDSAGKSSRIQPDLVAKWMEMIPPVPVPISKKRSLMPSVGMDCYFYGITVYDKSETRTLSLSCTDTYRPDKEDSSSVIDIGPIRDTLMNLPWE